MNQLTAAISRSEAIARRRNTGDGRVWERELDSKEDSFYGRDYSVEVHRMFGPQEGSKRKGYEWVINGYHVCGERWFA